MRPLKIYHGKVGRGLSVEMSVKYGPAALLSVVEDSESRFKLLVAEGDCVAGEILEIGNTNSQHRFPIGWTEHCEHVDCAGSGASLCHWDRASGGHAEKDR